MNLLKKNLIPLTLMLLIPIETILYGVLNNSLRGVHYLVTPLDNSIPFLKIFIIPYLLYYPFIAFTLIYLCFYYRKVYYKTIVSLFLGMLISYLVYFIFQTATPRPQLHGNDLLTSLVVFIYNQDNPFNCFPSIHVLTSYLMIKGIMKSDEKSLLIKASVWLVGLSIILSTQFIKQHVILDLVSGILLAEIIYKIVDIINSEMCPLWIKKLYSLDSTK
ncbi:inositol phosphorylceramide synthase [Clostridium sp. P21]|uniref:Inositol phosphorylceramide synthase n=1 Tax=Clostridium muellerianum TaxID=2716538 RepID=A0A7Y0ENG3_9CLOT|nr:phosphatase PAP2 family protein [Clostridium muellerianum]NMM65560.1 inositol phosphorylceramide synthase [Clostridium muellerianum]